MNLSHINLLELDNPRLENTSFSKALASLPFNAGFILKRIGSKDNNTLKEILSNLKNTIKLFETNDEVHDLIYEVLIHENIRNKWTYNDGEFFTSISEKYNSKEKFQKIGLFEIDNEEFKNRLLLMLSFGSCYGSLNNSEYENKTFCEEFFKETVEDGDKIIVSNQPWGQYYIGFFVCLFILKKEEIIIIAYDDYD